MKKIIYKVIGVYLNVTAPLFPKMNREQAFRLLCRVKPIPVSQEGHAFYSSAETRYFNVSNTDVALHKWGTGDKKLFFLHGWMSYSYRWKLFIDTLDLSEFTVYSLDAPAHGFSKGKFLNIEMYREAAAKAIASIGAIDTLVCHSLGSLVGAYLYLENKNVPVNSFVIMGAPSGMDAIFAYFQEMLNLHPRTIKNLNIKINSVLKVPADQLSMKHFFESVVQPTMVIHERTDIVTPFEPIEKAIPSNTNIKTVFTTGQNHNLIGKDTIEAVLTFVNQQKEPLLCL